MRRIASSFIALAAVLAVSACSSGPAVDSRHVSGSGTGVGGQGTTPQQSRVLTEAERLEELQNELQATIGDRVFFSTDEYTLNAQSRGIIDRQVAFLRSHPEVQLSIQGHADERGTREYNLALGDRRANSVKQYMMTQGIAPNRLVTVSFGKERPEAVGTNESSWAQNRRAVSIIVR